LLKGHSTDEYPKLTAGKALPDVAAEHESGFDAVDGSSTGTWVPRMWVLFGAPDDSEEPTRAA